MDKKYYIKPPHAVRDEKKLESMVARIQSGQPLPPVIILDPDGGDMAIALSGSHRIAAYTMAGVDPDIMIVRYKDYAEAMDHIGLDPIYDTCGDYDDLLDVIASITDDRALAAAIKQQEA